MAEHDLVIRNCTLLDDNGTFDVKIDGGLITGIEPSSKSQGAEVIEADGNLVAPAFVNGHMHLCKTYTYDEGDSSALRQYTSPDMGGAMHGIELAATVKKSYTPETVYARALKAAREGLANGVLFVQAFADTDTTAGLAGFQGVARVRDELRDTMNIQVVAFPQDGIHKDPGADAIVEQALRAGADVVGGIPWIELTDEEARSHVDLMLDLASAYKKRVAMLVDDTGDPSMRTLEYLAAQTFRRQLQGQVTACHARAASTYPQASFERLTKLLLRSGVGVVSDPHTGPLHVRPYDLYDAGVHIALGQDDIEDAYYPLGRHNMLEVAFVAAHILGDLSPNRLRALFDMVTVSAARTLGIREHNVAVGSAANMVVLHGRSLREALIRHERPRVVISRGRVVARTETETQLLV